MLRDQHFSSLFRHYGKHNGVDKETLVFFFTEQLMQELMPSDTPRSVHLRKNDVIVIRAWFFVPKIKPSTAGHRRQPQPDGFCVRLDLGANDVSPECFADDDCTWQALDLLRAFPRARSAAAPIF